MVARAVIVELEQRMVIFTNQERKTCAGMTVPFVEYRFHLFLIFHYFMIPIKDNNEQIPMKNINTKYETTTY